MTRKATLNSSTSNKVITYKLNKLPNELPRSRRTRTLSMLKLKLKPRLMLKLTRKRKPKPKLWLPLVNSRSLSNPSTVQLQAVTRGGQVDPIQLRSRTLLQSITTRQGDDRARWDRNYHRRCRSWAMT